MASPPSGPPPTSPRSNLSRLLSVTLGAEATQSQQELQQQMDILMQADAENKVRNRKLYLILDLDETLVYSQRMKPGAVPVGHQIMVHNQPFDMVLRPGLEHFLKVIQKQFVVFMYTMGDEGYTHAVLDVIDPQRAYFRGAIPPNPPPHHAPPNMHARACAPAAPPSRGGFPPASNPRVAGGVCSWRDTESRLYKFMSRLACDKVRLRVGVGVRRRVGVGVRRRLRLRLRLRLRVSEPNPNPDLRQGHGGHHRRHDRRLARLAAQPAPHAPLRGRPDGRRSPSPSPSRSRSRSPSPSPSPAPSPAPSL